MKNYRWRIVGYWGVLQLVGPVSSYYQVVPPRWSLLSSVLFTIVPMLYKIKNTWLILLSHFIFTFNYSRQQSNIANIRFDYPNSNLCSMNHQYRADFGMQWSCSSQATPVGPPAILYFSFDSVFSHKKSKILALSNIWVTQFWQCNSRDFVLISASKLKISNLALCLTFLFH